MRRRAALSQSSAFEDWTSASVSNSSSSSATTSAQRTSGRSRRHSSRAARSGRSRHLPSAVERASQRAERPVGEPTSSASARKRSSPQSTPMRPRATKICSVLVPQIRRSASPAPARAADRRRRGGAAQSLFGLLDGGSRHLPPRRLEDVGRCGHWSLLGENLTSLAKTSGSRPVLFTEIVSRPPRPAGDKPPPYDVPVSREDLPTVRTHNLKKASGPA